MRAQQLPDGNPLFTDRTWQDLPGAKDVRIYPYIRKIDTLSSNSYLLSLTDCLILIDPGALPEQMEHMVTVIRKELDEKSRPLLVIITHIHGDHWLQVLENAEFQKFPIYYIVQEYAAIAFANNDSRITQASIFGTRFGSIPVSLALFRKSDAGIGPENGELSVPEFPFRYSYGVTHAPDGREIRCQQILLTKNTLDFYHTPGHNTDCICIRIGDVLFTGDLHFAATTGIAGLAGWDQGKLLQSIEDVKGILAGTTIQVCCPGHGRPLPANTMATTLEALRRDVESLEAIEELNIARARQVAAYGEGLVSALGEIFTIIEGRLYYVEYVLDELEESGEAELVGKLLGSGSIDDIIENFNAFLSEYQSAGKPDIYIMLKAGQVVSRLDNLFEREDLDWIIDSYLLLRAERLISDFMRIAKGHRPTVIVESVDLRPVITDAIACLNHVPPTDEELMESVEDPEKFRKLLAKKIASVNVSSGMLFEFQEGNGPFEANVDRDRIEGLLLMLLEEEIGMDAGEIEIRLSSHEDNLILTITGTSTLREESDEMPSQKLRFLEEEAALAGGVLRSEFLPGKTIFSLEMGTGSLLSMLLPNT